ncbi:MAG: carboxypeptidase regulatory-like domain-containing protein [Acidobacteria bacterium]|nr:carboxypeptidase regulatory-like domain-containing protein [Acidobacteriota bacterium]
MIRRLFVLPLCALVLLFLVAAPGAQPSGTLVTGTVVDGALSPLAGASITLERQAVVVSRTTSDAEGRFTFQNVAPGDYRVRATHRSAPTLVREFRVAAGVAAVKLPLVMAPAVEVTAAAKTVDALGQSLPALLLTRPSRRRRGHPSRVALRQDVRVAAASHPSACMNAW